MGSVDGAHPAGDPIAGAARGQAGHGTVPSMSGMERQSSGRPYALSTRRAMAWRRRRPGTDDGTGRFDPLAVTPSSDSDAWGDRDHDRLTHCRPGDPPEAFAEGTRHTSGR